MKRAFRKNILRTIGKSMGRYLAILAIIALGVGFFTGLKASKPAMMKTGQAYIEEQKLYDYRLVSSWGFDENEISEINKLSHVEAAEGAVWADFICEDSDRGEICLKALSITETVNRLTVTAGRLPERADECVLDAYYYQEDMIGQEIRVSDQNTQETKDSLACDTYTVTGLVRSPLYMHMERGTTTVGNGKLTAFLYLPLEGFNYEYFKEVYVSGDTEALAFTEAYDNDMEEWRDSLEEDCNAILEERYQKAVSAAVAGMLAAPELYVLDRSTNVGYASYESDVSIVEGIAKIFPLFFFLIAALVCSTTMTRMVDDERTQIGTLRAMGYTERAILLKYMVYSGSAAAVGAIAGYGFGIRLFPTTIWIAYGMLYGFTDIIITENVWLFAISMLAALLCSVGTTFAACRAELTHAPAQLIRPKAPTAGKRIFLERVPFLWKRLKFLHKVSARNVFRFKKRMFMMILGIAGCMALVLAGFGVKDSIANVVNNQYDSILKYHISASYTKEIDEELEGEIEEPWGTELAASAVLMETTVEAPYEGGSKTVTLMVSKKEEIGECVDFHLEGATVELPERGEILLDRRLAKLLQVETGDEITLKAGELESKPIKVAGVFENHIFYYAYMTGETYEDCFGEAFTPRTMYLKLTEGTDPYPVASYLSDMEGASGVSVVADMRGRVEQMMESVNYIVALIILSAAVLAFIVLFNLGNINISERVREIATLKVLGFYPRETGAYVFRENMVLSVLGMLCGIPLGLLLHRFVMEQIQIDMVSFEIRILPLSYLFSLALVLGFTVCVDLILRRKIEGIPMAESLKSAE